MKKDGNRRKIIKYTQKKRNIFIFLILVLFMGVGYSLVSENLNILGSINVLGYSASNEPAQISITYPDDPTEYAYNASVTVPVTYTNTSTVDALDVTLKCDQIQSSETHYDKLSPGESVTVSYTYTVTEEDIVYGDIELDMIAVFSDTINTNAEASELVVLSVEAMNPSLNLAFVDDSQNATPPQLAPGEGIVFALVLTNDGNVTITDITADTADAPTTLNNSAPGASENFYYSYTVPADAQEGLMTVELTVNGLDPNGDSFTTSLSVDINVSGASTPDPGNG